MHLDAGKNGHSWEDLHMRLMSPSSPHISTSAAERWQEVKQAAAQAREIAADIKDYSNRTLKI